MSNKNRRLVLARCLHIEGEPQSEIPRNLPSSCWLHCFEASIIAHIFFINFSDIHIVGCSK